MHKLYKAALLIVAAPILLAAQGAASPEKNDTTQASNYALIDITGQLTEDDYEELLDSLKRGHTTDYFKLRMAYTKTNNYDPYSTDASDMFNEASAHSTAREYEKALSIIEDILGNNYVSIKAHRWASYIYSKLQDSVKEYYHENIYEGLIESIIASGDGRESRTAYIVIDINEEFDLMDAYGLEGMSQSLVQSDGHNLDMIEAKEENKEEVFLIYFNVDLPIAHSESKFK